MYLVKDEKLKKLNIKEIDTDKLDKKQDKKTGDIFYRLSLDDIRKISAIKNIPISVIIGYIYDKISDEELMFSVFLNKYNYKKEKISLYICKDILEQIKKISEDLDIPTFSTNSKQVLYILFDYYLRLKKKQKLFYNKNNETK